MQSQFLSKTHSVLRNPDGSIDTVLPGERVVLETSVGTLIPRYTIDEESRKKEAPVKFYKSGELRSLPLEEFTEIETSVGKIQAELLTFYKSGALRRLFPLNGKITGYWTEENEYELAETLEIPTSLGNFSVKPIFLQFFETGELESILFWPKEKVSILTSMGEIEIRKGISFHKNGTIKAFEPVREIEVTSPIGSLKAYDPDPEGLFAKSSAIQFYENGDIESITTPSSQVEVRNKQGEVQMFAPSMISSYCNESMFFVSPMRILFEKEAVTFIDKSGSGSRISKDWNYQVSDFIPENPIAGIACG